MFSQWNKTEAYGNLQTKYFAKKVNFPSSIVVRAQRKGWMDEDGINFWLEKVWNQRPGAVFQKRSMLVWGMFAAHLKDNVKSKAAKMQTDLCVIPGGLTFQLQPLDVCLNKPFKDRMRQLWTEWMASDSASRTKGGNLQKPSLLTVCN